jgi:Flp pilus assembly protein TadG
MRRSAFHCLSTAARKLASDDRGNAMVLVAAAIIPLTAVVGGGLDIARIHLAQSRLSQACDAAALAGRRAMSNEDIETAKPEATKFFNFNFPQGYMNTTAFTPSITKPEVGTVKVEASTNVPTTIMRIFSYGNVPIKVDCNATQNFDNVDIVLVLDTTGSMTQNIAGTKDLTDGDSASRMYGLRQAVMALYDELKPAQDQLAAQGLRLRYGIVPYSSTVNVGKLIYAKSPNYIVSGNYAYYSRTPEKDKKGKFTGWNYGPVNYDISSYVSGGSLVTPTGDNGANKTLTWGGCIEERKTTSSILSTSSTTSIPSGAYDLDVDFIPNSSDTKWKPFLAGAYAGDDDYPSAIYDDDQRTSSTNGAKQYRPQMACPREASRLAVMSRSDMQNYVNSLYSDGGTYHDIGMNWGTRFISSGGIFGSDNPSEFGSPVLRPVNRYIIFMTDGLIDTGPLYTAYGLEKHHGRVTGGYSTDNDQTGRHKQRFLMACNAAKQKGISIWSIVFSPDTEDSLKTCASNDDQYAQSKNSADLIAKFKEIGKNIGALRLSK